MASENIGRVIQVIGPVVDIEFPNGVPAIYNAVNIEGGKSKVVVEVEQHLGENRVRCVAMQPTDGMVRGMKAVDTGNAIMVPVGPGTLGRVVNVLGQPIDLSIGKKPTGPLGTALSPDGKTAFVAMGIANQIAVIDLVQGKVLSQITVGVCPYAVVLSADGKTLATIQQKGTQTLYLMPATGFAANPPNPAPAQKGA